MKNSRPNTSWLRRALWLPPGKVAPLKAALALWRVAYRADHGYVRGHALIFSRWRRRPFGGEWHGERCGNVRRAAFVPFRAFIEEGLPFDDLARITQSMAQRPERAYPIVTGDAKVVNRAPADTLFITTAGIGVVPEQISISASNARPGDVVIVNGTTGDQGRAVSSQREGLEFEGPFSPIPPVEKLVDEMLAADTVHTLRDPTRGGLGTSLWEIAASSSVGIEIDAKFHPGERRCSSLQFRSSPKASKACLPPRVPASGRTRSRRQN